MKQAWDKILSLNDHVTITTADGDTIPLDEFIKDQEQQEEHKKYDLSFHQQSGELVPCIQRRTGHRRRKVRRGVTYTKCYTPEEIRGIEMEKSKQHTFNKFRSMIIGYVLDHPERPFTTRDICNKTGIDIKTMSGYVGKFYECFERHKYISRRPSTDRPKQYVYKWRLDYGNKHHNKEWLEKEFFDFTSKQYREKAAQTRAKKAAKKSETQKPSGVAADPTSQDLTKLAKEHPVRAFLTGDQLQEIFGYEEAIKTLASELGKVNDRLDRFIRGVMSGETLSVEKQSTQSFDLNINVRLGFMGGSHGKTQ